RMGGVQRFGEKRAFRRIIRPLCRSKVQNSNWKWLRLLGSIANEVAWRTHDLGQAGGGRGTGVEPSPRTPTQCIVTQRRVAATAPLDGAPRGAEAGQKWPSSLAAAEIANALHLRDFRSSAIFEFFNTIRQKRSFA